MSSSVLKSLGVGKKDKAAAASSSAASSSAASSSSEPAPAMEVDGGEASAPEQQQQLLPLWSEEQRQAMEAELATNPPQGKDIRDFYADPEIGLYAATVKVNMDLQQLYPERINKEKFYSDYPEILMGPDNFDPTRVIFPPSSALALMNEGADHPLFQAKFLYAVPDSMQPSGYQLRRPQMMLELMVAGKLEEKTSLKTKKTTKYRLPISLRPFKGNVPWKPLTDNDIRKIRMWNAKYAGLDAMVRQIALSKDSRFEAICSRVDDYYGSLDTAYYPLTHTKWTSAQRKSWIAEYDKMDEAKKSLAKTQLKSTREAKIKVEIFPIGVPDPETGKQRITTWYPNPEPSDPKMKLFVVSPVPGSEEEEVYKESDHHPKAIFLKQGRKTTRYALTCKVDLADLAVTAETVSFKHYFAFDVSAYEIVYDGANIKSSMEDASEDVRAREANVVTRKRVREDEEGGGPSGDGEPQHKRSHHQENEGQGDQDGSSQDGDGQDGGQNIFQ